MGKSRWDEPSWVIYRTDGPWGPHVEVTWAWGSDEWEVQCVLVLERGRLIVPHMKLGNSDKSIPRWQRRIPSDESIVEAVLRTQEGIEAILKLERGPGEEDEPEMIDIATYIPPRIDKKAQRMAARYRALAGPRIPDEEKALKWFSEQIAVGGVRPTDLVHLATQELHISEATAWRRYRKARDRMELEKGADSDD